MNAILADGATAVNADLVSTLDLAAPDAPSDADRAYWATVANVDAPDWFDPSEPSPPPPDADDHDPECAAAFEILGRLCADRPVSIPELNRMRAYFDAPTFAEACSCLAPEPHCGCGTFLWAHGRSAYVEHARNALAELDAYYDALNAERDPDEQDLEHMARAAFDA